MGKNNDGKKEGNKGGRSGGVCNWDAKNGQRNAYCVGIVERFVLLVV